MSPDELALASAFERPPAGTEGLTRTLLALLVLSLVGLALATVLVSVDTDLRNTIVTALLSILAAIAGFYFGSRTAQTSAEQATRQQRDSGPPREPQAPAPLPSVTAVEPNTGAEAGGDQMVLTGSSFTGATTVSFGPNPAPSFTADSDTQITAASPPGTGTVDVKVTTPAGTSEATATTRFTYLSTQTQEELGEISASEEVPAVPEDRLVDDETARRPVDTDLNEPDKLKEEDG
jgi:hypothetical protein